ncbi:cilia- and flagella-associated protein 44 [Onthophagus taurus]|uniref:cilia- and flagella-associated protein 44 n=1 Tax=Onthophagus taurus TaxID=166361 RepID=UPI0039BDBE67
MSKPESQAGDSTLGDLSSGYFIGGEDFGEEEEEIYEEPPVILTAENLISGPYLTTGSTVPRNILEFDFSYGYDCKKFYNLVVADPDTLMFISGNLINFFHVPTKQLTFRRSAFGGGLGHMTKNPNVEYPHIAIAENGEHPPIIIYDWPALEVVCFLRGGTSKCFHHLNYSPEGDLLVSQGGEPDHLITVWNWRKSRILLRTKSYVSDVYRVLFSPYCPGQLSTCGLAHIKFWKMIRTFTGLKLQGELGRFGKTEYSDIMGIYPMPDEKVISGSSWGNILVWEAGLIKIEVFRKLRKKCHEAPIVKFDFIDGELWTVSMDGSVKVWHYDSIEQADPPDDDRVVQIEPIFNFKTPNCQFMTIDKRGRDEKDTFYYAQDGNGGLWLIDLTTELNVTPSRQLYFCHAGAISDMATCPYGNYFVSFGIDGRLQLYNYIKKSLLMVQQYPAKGKCMMWVPISVDPSGDVLILGFDDGCLRIVVLTIKEEHKHTEYKTTTIQITKPHNKPLRCMSLNSTEEILVTAGEDSTIFVYKVAVPVEDQSYEYIELLPIGYVQTSDIVTYITFHNTDVFTVILGCEHGYINIIPLPHEQQQYTTITYVLHVNPIVQRFYTYKSQIRRDIYLKEVAARKLKKLEKKKKALEIYKKENEGLEVDEELFLADSESEEILEPLFVPDVPNNVLWIQHTVDNTLWVSMSGYDAGYIYEYHIGQKDEVPFRFKMIYHSDDIEINNFIYNSTKKYLIFAMQNGEIRVVKVKKDFRNLSDYWQLSMHDNYNGFVPKMCFSYDEKYFFTCGHDGNIFSYLFNPENDEYCDSSMAKLRQHKQCSMHSLDDLNSYKNLSLEETIVKKEQDRKDKLANDRKQEYYDKIHVLKKEFLSILKKNQKLLPTQRIPREKLELDPRITKDLNKVLDANLALVRRKLAYQLEKSELRMEKLKKHFIDPLDMFPIAVSAVRTPIKVTILRQKRLPDKFEETKEYVEQKLIEAELKGRPPERAAADKEDMPAIRSKSKQLEYFLSGLSAYTLQHKLEAKIMRILKKYRMRKIRIEKRQAEWDQFNATKPKDGVNNPEDNIAYSIALDTIGDYKLKSAHDYKIPKHLRETKLKKYKQLLTARERQFNLRHNFNKKVHDLRNKKVQLRDTLQDLENLLKDVQSEIPPSHRENGPDVIELKDEDFPEKNLDLVLNLPIEMRKRPPLEVVVVSEPTDDLLEKEVLPCLQFGVALEHDEVISPWEDEIKQIRIKRKVFQQKRIISKMNHQIDKFDNAVEEIYKEHLQLAMDAKFLDLYILTLNQELIILKHFESGENKLADDIRTLQETVLDQHDILKQFSNRIETYKREIANAEDEVKVIQKSFQDAAGGNKFFDFLRRIFKKKYKPPKIVTDDDDSDSDSSSSSSSEDDDDDEGSSDDSRNVGVIRMDESVCPKGCDQSLYDTTFQLRNDRHAIEQLIKDRQTAIETTKKDIDNFLKKNRATELELEGVQEELEARQREKQRELNEIMCVVILKMNQFQHLIENDKLVNIKNTLLFSKSILARLHKRVGQLQFETEYQQKKHQKDVLHLMRMKTDCKQMEKTILHSYEEVSELMRIKFGKCVNIDEITESSLKRMICEMKLTMMDIRSLYEKEIIFWGKKFAFKQTYLAQELRNNTEKLELLALLNVEKTELMKILKVQDEKRCRVATISEAKEHMKNDILKLSEVARIQHKELRLLCEEIRKLKTKGLKLRPCPTRGHYEEEVEEEELPLMELDENDDVVFLEDYEWENIVQPAESFINPFESRNAAREILKELFDELDLQREARTISEDVIDHILKQVSVTAIIEDILDMIPQKLEEEKLEIVEYVAERLFALTMNILAEQSTSEQVVEEILELILNDTYEVLDNIDDVVNMLNDLVESVPLKSILEESSILKIISKIINATFEIEQEELTRKAMEAAEKKEDMEQVLKVVLERVYGIGIDYLYYINI